MKETLTKEELDLIDVVKDQWLSLAYEKCGDGIDKPLFEENINWVYKELLKLEKPEIVYCDSIVEALIKITMVKDFELELDEYPVYFQKYMDKTLSEEFITKIKENLSLKNSYIGWSNFGWVCFYDYFTQIGVLDDEKFNKYKELIKSNVFECFEFEFAVFAVTPPKEVKLLNTLPHSIDGPAISFQDGTGYYYVNGVMLEEELYLKVYNKELTFSDFLNESNEEIKSAILFFIEQRDGTDGVFNFIRENLKEVNTFVHKPEDIMLEGTTKSDKIGVYTLFTGTISGTKVGYVRCYCPSTDRMFFLGCEPTFKSAKNAIASLYQIPKVLVNKIKTISRQGEKFSTTFDDITTEKLRNGEYLPEELNEYVSISGDKYFKLMSYEY